MSLFRLLFIDLNEQRKTNWQIAVQGIHLYWTDSISVDFSNRKWNNRMTSKIQFSLNISAQSRQGHKVKPALPMNLLENDTKKTIAINKIASASTKSCSNKSRPMRLESRKCFLPINPTIEKAPSPISFDIQSKLGKERKLSKKEK